MKAQAVTSNEIREAGFIVPSELAAFPAVPRQGVLLTLEQEQTFGYTMFDLTLKQMRAMACDLDVVDALLDDMEGAFTKCHNAEKAVALVLVDGLWIRNGSVKDALFSSLARARIAAARDSLGALKRLKATDSDLFYCAALERLRSDLSALVPYDMIFTQAARRFKDKCAVLSKACKDLSEFVAAEMHISKPTARKVCEQFWLSNKLSAISISSNRYVQSLMPSKAKRDFRLAIVQRQQQIANVALSSGVPVAQLLSSWSLFSRAALKKERMADTFAQMNTGLVTKIAFKYNFATDFDAVRSAALQGLSRAIGLYAPESGFKFSTYAVKWITQTILRQLSKQDTVRLPEGSHEMLMRLRAVYIDLPNASDAYVCATTNISLEKLQALRPYVLGTSALSLDSNPGDDQDGTGLHTLIADDNYNFAAKAEAESESAHISSMIRNLLTEREYYVLKYRTGLEGVMEKSVAALAEILGTSQQNISRIEKGAQQKVANAPELMRAWADNENV
jgi:RNA polymerase sigma factor (sigma-70 family)